MILQVIRLVLLNVFLHLAWALKSIDLDNPDENFVKEVVTKRNKFMEQLQSVLQSLLESWEQDDARYILTCTVCPLNLCLAACCFSVLKNYWGCADFVPYLSSSIHIVIKISCFCCSIYVRNVYASPKSS